MQEQEERLANLKEHLRTRKEDAMEKKKEVAIKYFSCYVSIPLALFLTQLQIARTECAEVEKQSQEMTSRQREV